MNKQRRKEITALYKDVEKLGPLAATVAAAITDFYRIANDIHEEIDRIAENERESLDNLPESLQGSERALTIEQAHQDLLEARDKLNPGEIDWDTFNHDDLIGKLDEAAGMEE